jgi:uncharacterized Zn finger protein (UPF0148 family)
MTTRCPICGRPNFEVVMFTGRYYTSCCNQELAMAEEEDDDE